ncbi:DUF5348 domain-containing protein [Sutcliffiella horikoshii]|uniref:DUF5348 domain-containing protein n=1 Tax=Sutcliffiella horikoshii TaxID=79883 RepID=UPI0038502411
MKSRWKDMIYSEAFDCWIVVWGDNTGYKMRCGEWFDLHLGNGRRLTCRLELGRDWYILTGRNDVRFYLKKNEKYQVDL